MARRRWWCWRRFNYRFDFGNGPIADLARRISERQGDHLVIVFKDDVARSFSSQLGDPQVARLFN